MSTTTLAFENIIIGCFTWTWVFALFVRLAPVTSDYLTKIMTSGLESNPAPLGVAFILLVYPIGSMMNTLCYGLARWIFAERHEKKVLANSVGEVQNFEDMTKALKFVAQYGKEQLYEDLQVYRPFMRISRAAVINFFILTLALLGDKRLFPYMLVSLGIFVISIPACICSYRFQSEEIARACEVLKEYEAKLNRRQEEKAFQEEGGGQPRCSTGRPGRR